MYENKKCKKQNFEWKYENSLQIIIEKMKKCDIMEDKCS